MSIPTAVCIDTSIFDGQRYNFFSTALTTFVSACAKRGIRLIVPDPIEREVKRHLATRTAEALQLLDRARKEAPFLDGWSGVPKPTTNAERHQATRAGVRAWQLFLTHFEVDRLGYDGLNMSAVMSWYDDAEPPFGKGAKRKEFPDAISLALLDRYADRRQCYVAVVSQDKDFAAACGRFRTLLHFGSLPRLTELLLSDDSRIGALHRALEKGVAKIEAAIADELFWLVYTHNDAWFHLERSERGPVEIADIRIVALGDGECTIAFDVGYQVDHVWKWEAPGPDGDFETEKGETSEWVCLTAAAKARFDEQTGELVAVTNASLDQADWEVRALPSARSPR